MTDTIETPSELDSLKTIADNMGITYSPNIGIETLQARIDEARAKVPQTQSKSARHAAKAKELSKLVRVTVVNMNPSEKDWKGVFITAANKATGTVKKYVPFSVPFHVPQIIYNVMKDKVWRKTEEVRGVDGKKTKVNHFVPSYGITVLDPLTPEELAALSDDQKKRGAIE